jgi:lipoprotein-releasing system ATP-binding protein
VLPLIEATNLHKTYRLGKVNVPVLRGVDLQVDEGSCIAVLGASGSGKSTLLHLLGGLDRPDRGNGLASAIEFDGTPISSFGAREMDRYRNRAVGFVFQFYHLLPELNVLENAMLGALVGVGRVGYARRAGEIRARATALLERFGLEQRLRHRPAELSGGERQRVAIARALVNAPRLLLADEPTGNLDEKTGASILDALLEHRSEAGLTMVMVTHDVRVANRADRIVRLKDGVVVEETPANA